MIPTKSRPDYVDGDLVSFLSAAVLMLMCICVLSRVIPSILAKENFRVDDNHPSRKTTKSSSAEHSFVKQVPSSKICRKHHTFGFDNQVLFLFFVEWNLQKRHVQTVAQYTYSDARPPRLKYQYFDQWSRGFRYSESLVDTISPVHFFNQG
jgi:hypothetical protein